jgi:hypothetical protein
MDVRYWFICYGRCIFRIKVSTKFYFHPQLNAQFDVYESIIIPYAGVNGGLQKNSLRSLSNENPFIIKLKL